MLVVAEDVRERGIQESELISGIRLIERGALPRLCEEHAIVSMW